MKNYSDLNKSLPGLNQGYQLSKLEEKNLAKDPFEQFAHWLEEAVKEGTPKANAMVLATASSDGIPSSRVVLLKGFSEKGFVFYTNYNSPKAKDLETNPYASLLFFYAKQERQIRIYGKVERTSKKDSAAYFDTRPDDSKLAAWISEQSQVIPDRVSLERKLKDLRKKFTGKPIPLPNFWGGYRLIPEWFEFWQGREHRLNDRLRYRREKNRWIIERLAP